MPVLRSEPVKINYDKDPRKLEETEMVDALNVRPLASEEGKKYNGKNAFGNRVIDESYTLPAGENKKVGSCRNKVLGVIYYALWNSNGNHRVVRYSLTDLATETIIESADLRFGPFMFVDMWLVIGNNGQEILFLSDGVNRPKRIIRGNDYSSNEEQRITAIAKPPEKEPTIAFIKSTEYTDNHIYDKAFQFASRFVYKNGEVSVLSPYSIVAVDPSISLHVQKSNDVSTLTANGVRITCPYGNEDVDRVQVLMRTGNDGPFYKIHEIDNSLFASEFSFDFFNENSP